MANRRLPRIRGDRPYGIEIYYDGEAATPHTRGSTLNCYAPFIISDGYPAYAGIDHKRLEEGNMKMGLPRIRGDRPLKENREELKMLATPHTRGSTLLPSKGRYYVGGYPAYAGIDPLD